MSDLTERLLRTAESLQSHRFGVPFLDDALNGIRPTDLTIIAGKTGAGKTQLGTSIALQNAQAEVPVTLIALEAEEFEIERRIKYQLIAKEFFANRSDYPEHIKLNFTDWLFDKYGDALLPLEEHAQFTFEKISHYLRIYAPSRVDFSKRDFVSVYEEFAKESRIIILDHLHYLAADDREGEYDHIKKTMWALRDAINKNKVSIIALSHLRKETKKDSALIFGLEELHGSSEITKQANHVIGFSPVFELPKKENMTEKFIPPIGSTLCKVLKTRTGHSGSDRYVAFMQFNLSEQHYGDSYTPYKIDRHNMYLTPMRYTDFEHWMGKAREAKN